MTSEVKRPLRKKPRDSSSDWAVPPTTVIVSAVRPGELQRIWRSARAGGAACDANRPLSAQCDESIPIPSFKVGTLEMYRRFPKQYDLLMRRHDCSAVESHIHALLTTLSRMDGPVRVADFGCGTGRMAAMAARHRSVAALCCYDGEAAMLHECVKNVTRTVAASRPDVRRIVWRPTAADAEAETNALCTPSAGEEGDSIRAEAEGHHHDHNHNNENKNNNHHDHNDHNDHKNSDSEGPGAVMDVCVRPVCFAAVQRGFLAAPRHLRCGLVVCAWALSYVMRAQWGGDRWHAAVDETLHALIALLGDGPGAVVVIETLGTGAAAPTRRNTLAQRLEEHWGFARQWVRTDYEFRDKEEAAALTKFFFGDAVARHVVKDGGRATLEECTGIWTLTKDLKTPMT